MLAGVAACQPAKTPTPRPSVAIFPSDVLAVPDVNQATGKRVNMPMPDCTAFPSDCNELALINQLDGFDLDPNITLLFDGPIDVNRVTDANLSCSRPRAAPPSGSTGSSGTRRRMSSTGTRSGS